MIDWIVWLMKEFRSCSFILVIPVVFDVIIFIFSLPSVILLESGGNRERTGSVVCICESRRVEQHMEEVA